jgi:V8-like Glu-specific endopeptidase
MDIWTATRTVLEKNPGLRRKFLLPQVIVKTGKGKTAICSKWSTWALQGKIYREKGKYWLEKPTQSKIMAKKNQNGFFDWLERRTERKRLERERKLRRIEVRGLSLIEEAMMNEDEWTPEKFAKIRKKYCELLEPS